MGNPVRAAVLARTNVPYRGPGDWPLNVLVIGGSQGAGMFARVMPAAVALLPEGLRARLRLSQQVRPEDMARAQDDFADLGVAAELRGFFEDAPERLAQATLVISRAGAGSIADITAIGRPAILIPIRTPPTTTRRPMRLGWFPPGSLPDPRGGVDAGPARGACRRDPVRSRGR